jgi:hypothetical protein
VLLPPWQLVGLVSLTSSVMLYQACWCPTLLVLYTLLPSMPILLLGARGPSRGIESPRLRTDQDRGPRPWRVQRCRVDCSYFVDQLLGTCAHMPRTCAHRGMPRQRRDSTWPHGSRTLICSCFSSSASANPFPPAPLPVSPPGRLVGDGREPGARAGAVDRRRLSESAAAHPRPRHHAAPKVLAPSVFL